MNEWMNEAIKYWIEPSYFEMLDIKFMILPFYISVQPINSISGKLEQMKKIKSKSTFHISYTICPFQCYNFHILLHLTSITGPISIAFGGSFSPHRMSELHHLKKLFWSLRKDMERVREIMRSMVDWLMPVNAETSAGGFSTPQLHCSQILNYTV